MKVPLPRLHAITDEKVARRSDIDQIAAQLASPGGDVALHARGHSLTGLEHFRLATRLSAYAPATLFVNDRLDIALAAGAAGVQLRSESLSVAEARRIEARWWIGRSVHSLEEARAALAEGADYLLVGPMFETTTHPGGSPLTAGTLQAIAGLGLPVIAIGGVTAARIPALRRAGAHGVAAIRALWDASHPGAAAQEMLAALDAA